MRMLLQALHSRIDAVEKARCKIMKSTNHERSAKNKEMRGVLKHHQKAGLPEERTLPGSNSFTATCLDIMNNVNVKMLANKRAETKVAYDHRTSTFKLHWNHLAVRGRPTKR